MQNLDSLQEVMVKIEDLKASLKFSNDMVPLVSDVFRFIKDIVPLLLDANFSLKESTDHLPTATDNLAKVTKTTEMAANEVMDRLDGINGKLENLKNDIGKFEDSKKYIGDIEIIQNESMEIMYSFQFQDITTQQLQHVERILQAINEKFSGLFKSFTQLKEGSGLGSDIYRAIENEIKQALQSEHKEFFADRTEDIIHNDGISQEMIDNLFK